MGEKHCFESVATGIGQLMLGAAALIGAFAAKDVASNYLSVNQNQKVSISLTQVCGDANRIEQSANDPSKLISIIKELPEKPSSDGSGIFIDSSFKEALQSKIRSEDDPEKRKAIVQDYFEKSLRPYHGVTIK